MVWRPGVSREALLCTALAATVGAVLAWLGPPGTDFAAHLYQRTLFIRHGFTFWDNFWYAGRYGFVDYSLVYYPLAAWFGIRVLAVAAVSVAALGFAVVTSREWGPLARWSIRSFALVWAGFMVSAAFPFMLGVAFALLAIWALQAGHRWRFAALTVLTLAASPVALVLLVVVLAGVALGRRSTPREAAMPALVPSGLGDNVARLRDIAVPVAVLVIALCRWRPLPLMLAFAGLALGWNVPPLAVGLVRGGADLTAHSAVWRAPLAYLHAHLRPGYRVEAVDTTEHWPAFYLAESGIPLVRGWFRQDDFPFDALLYRRLTPAGYRHWLREFGAAYVVLSRAVPDYSSRQEATMVRSGRAGLPLVWASRNIAIYAVPRARPIIAGPGRPEVSVLRESRLLLRVTRGGTYRVAVRWSPYWRASTGCLARTRGGLLLLRTRDAATVRIALDVDAVSLVDAFAGTTPRCPERKSLRRRS